MRYFDGKMVGEVRGQNELGSIWPISTVLKVDPFSTCYILPPLPLITKLSNLGALAILLEYCIIEIFILYWNRCFQDNR